MSGETEKDVSGWTVDTLHSAVISRLNALRDVIEGNDKRYEQRFLAQESAVQSALVAQEKAVNAALTAADRAVAKAEQAQERRNEATNEFRGQLADQAATLMPRKEAEQLISSLRNQMDVEMTAVNNKVDLEIRRSDRGEGRSTGFSTSWAIVLAVVGTLIGIAGVVIAILRLTS